MKTYYPLIFLLVAFWTQVIVAGVPQELKQHIIDTYDPTTASNLNAAIARLDRHASSEMKKETVQRILRTKDVQLIAWALAEPNVAMAAIDELKKTRPTAIEIRAVCAAILQAAAPDGAAVLHEGDADNPSLVVWHLKQLFDELVSIKTSSIGRSGDGEYHKTDVRLWISQAVDAANAAPHVSAEVKAALKTVAQ